MPDEYTAPQQPKGPSSYSPERREELMHRLGPPVLGVIIVLILLAAGWYVFRNRSQNAPQLAEASLAPSASVEPGSTLQPILNVQPSPSPSAEQLPKTGFPTTFVALISAFAVLTGWKLIKVKI